MNSFRNQSAYSLLIICWIMVLGSIPAMSFFGRRVQYWMADNIGYTPISWGLLGFMLAFFVIGLLWLKKTQYSLPYLHLAWLLPIFLILPLLLDRIEERVHFVSFGLLGLLSMLLFSPRIALIICLVFSAGDEVFQYYLPDRVGDWRDVGFNLLASISAAVFIYKLRTVNNQHADSGNG